MSNHGTRFDGFIPGQITVIGDTQTENRMFDLPNGREAAVQIRTQLQEPDIRQQQREEFFATVYPPSLTEGLEKELASLTERFNDFTGYDKNGQPIMRVQGRERELLEMKMATRRNALQTARQNRAYAERIQAQAKAAKQEEQKRVEAAAQERAKQLVEEDLIERRAKRIAARFAELRD